MGILTRIVKVMAALLTSNLVSVATQLLLPPIFLLRYGTTLYGEWLALSVTVAYLGTLNFGIQTYVTQDLTVRYQRQDLASYHVRQSTALRVLLGILVTAALVALVVFVLPLRGLLRLTIPQHTAAITLYMLALQVLLGVLFSYFTGMYMVISRAHTGVLWANGQRLALVFSTSLALWSRASFPVLALVQLLVYVGATLLLLLHVRVVAPQIFPRLAGWDRGAVPGILRPSSYFGLISMSTFLSFQVPVLILQRESGPFIVVAFTVMRTIFSMCRQVLNAPTQALGPEITRLFGLQEWGDLTRVYSYSERLIFTLIPMVNLGVLMVSPVMLLLWLHKHGLFSVLPYVLMAAVSMTLSAKEHKFQFQFSTNTHERLARIMFFGYIALVALAVPMVHWYGLMGFLVTWLAIELYQTGRILQLNQDFFAHTGEHTLKYVYRLAGLSVVGLIASGLLLRHTSTASYWTQFDAGIGVSFAVGGAAFFLFDMREILKKLLARLSNHMGWAKA
jgi:O-antigen/teichoic acid export membrane protein